MKITIDTSQDSHSEIKKAIRLLQSIVGHETEVYSNASSRNIFDSPESTLGSSEADPEPPANAFANMFDSAPATNAESETKEDEDKDLPELQLY